MIVLRRGFQLVVPFENKARRNFEWSLFKPIITGAGFYPADSKPGEGNKSSSDRSRTG